ncbi:MAG: hypothetical protein KBD66_04310 [Candidatus Doudnabacteria bacterium]|nr:hypothetical protein [Candidatus Doudnabacteria bacterium]
MLSTEFIELRKRQLLAKKTELETRLSAIPVHTELGNDYGDAELEEVVDMPNDQVIDELKDHLTRIEAALIRIESGEYGKDVNTGAWIDERRLTVYPEAETAMGETETPVA